MEILGIQLNIAWEDPAANFKRAACLVEQANPSGPALVVLPEMFATGFSMNVSAVVEPPGGPAEEFMASVAKEHGVHVMGGVVVSGGEKARNEAVVFSPAGKEVARYCKVHPFSFAGEADHYESGDEIVLFGCSGLRVSPFICYDLRFPEVFRTAAGQGADLFVVIANWPAVREAHWSALLRARAIENQSYVVGVNRCGSDPNHAYSGRSAIVDPMGEVMARLDDEEGVMRALLDAEAPTRYRREFPALADMRSDELGFSAV